MHGIKGVRKSKAIDLKHEAAYTIGVDEVAKTKAAKKRLIVKTLGIAIAELNLNDGLVED